MESELSIDIDGPIAEVFELALRNVAEWSITCVEDEILEERNDGGAGTTFRLVTEEQGRRMEFQGVVTRYEPPLLSEVHLEGQMFNLDVLYTFEDLGGTTRVTQKSKVQGKGFARVMFFLTGWMMKKSSCDAQMNELESLKQFCESRHA